jgi:elongator complex protein 1
LDIFANDQRNYCRALILYAEYLETNEEFEEAAALYLLAKNESKSLDCYKKSLSWQEAFTVAHILNYSDEELFKMGSEIIKSLLEANKHHHAARVAMDYQSDISSAIEILSLGGYWNEAVRIGMKHNIPEVMKNLIQPKMLESLKYLRDDIYELSTSFKRDKERISQVRKKNARKKEYANDPNLENIDLQSDTSSMATTFISGTSLSNMSSRTARTAKQKRKMERIKAAGKVEAFQEEFLTESLRKHIEKGNDLQGKS